MQTKPLKGDNQKIIISCLTTVLFILLHFIDLHNLKNNLYEKLNQITCITLNF